MVKLVNRVKNIFFKNKIKFNFLGKNTHIMKDSTFIEADKIKIGDNVYVASNNVWYGYGGISIGNGTIIAHNVEILTRNHNYDSPDLKSIPYDKIYINKPVIIKENVWIGAHVLIVPGITIEEGAVIGMGAVVTKDVPKGAVVGGNPAKIIKYRNISKYDQLKGEDKIYLDIKYK
ncbi:acyltransferase [Aerococcus urinaeequi]|uniref:acyltransferase n=1 Tax=Aerococcus urinaeequi TaxID=51665 RepID=UPI003D6AA9AE